MMRLLSICALIAILILADFSFALAEELPDSAYVIGVVGHAQSYAIDCEARSAADLAGFWGIYVSETQLLQALPSSDNPDEGFVGSPNGTWGRIPPNSYGVHAGPVAEALRAFGLPAEARRDLGWDDLRREISAGHPAIVWVIGSMWSGTPVDYQAVDGTISRVAAYEHTMLITGYSTRSVQVIDAGSGQYEYYWLNDFLNSWSVLGNMAVFATPTGRLQKVIAAPEEVTPPQVTTPEASGDTYTVQTGDHLMAVARNFGVSWQSLAEINSIYYPYTIYAGQVLTLPPGLTNVIDNELQPQVDPTSVDSAPTSKELNPKQQMPFAQHNFNASTGLFATSTFTESQQFKTMIVLNTDTLIGFARSIGVAWHVVAQLNNLPGTYVVHPGEILKVP